MRILELFAYLRVHDATRAIEFYKQAFGATERFRLTEPSGRVGHAELEFNGTVLMLSDEFPECGCVGPRTIGNTSVTIHLHVDNADEVLARAVTLGATLVRPATDAFYGERGGTVRDPFGHEWLIRSSRSALRRCRRATRSCLRLLKQDKEKRVVARSMRAEGAALMGRLPVR